MLEGADLRAANLIGANLRGADLKHATLVGTNLTDADLTGCHVYGISAWDLKLEGAKQRDLVISDSGDAEVTVDNIEVGQFIYLLLHNEKIRDVIDTIGKKGVLLLGRFTEGRFAVLEQLRTELRERDFVPMVFNFDKPETKDFTETVRLLASLSRFVIADITNPRSAPSSYRPRCQST
jgi:Pentapeptide repeats (8 copies)